jgi:hypothetical protein
MPLVKKIIIIFAVVVLILFIALVIAAWYLGTFASVNLSDEYRGPYNLVVLSQLVPYHESSQAIERVDLMLEEKEIRQAQSVVIFYDDPTKIPMQQVHTRAGFVVSDSVKVDSPFIFQTVEKRRVAVASMKAHPAIAPFKTYPALQEWIQKNEYLTVNNKAHIELYYSNGLVEVEMPIMVD